MSNVIEIQSGDNPIVKTSKMVESCRTDNHQSNELHHLNDHHLPTSILHENLSKGVVESLIMPKTKTGNKAISPVEDSIINEIVDLIFNELGKGIDVELRNQHIVDHLNNQNLTSQETVNRLSN